MVSCKFIDAIITPCGPIKNGLISKPKPIQETLGILIFDIYELIAY